ncbi:MAG: c-type cytochrome, partial [Verrucomicrobia bacterium]|nr:c-type cytochrome [Verrucomicrobiota bacterium]
MSFIRQIFLTAAVAATTTFHLAAAPKDSAGVEFFENKIRPLLIENCYECHGEAKQKGGLRLDTRDGTLKGGDTGPAIVPGAPEKSLLIKAVRYTDKELQMPPKNKRLSPAQVADLEAWVKMGAPDPRTGSVPAASHPPLSDPAKVKSHWAYQPVKDPPAPAVK